MLSIYNAVDGVVNSFTGIFNYLRMILILTTLIIIILLAINTNKRNNKFIGIMKCFGMRRYDLIKLFVIQTLFNILLIFIFIIGGVIIGTNIANNILEKSISHFLKFDITGLNIISINFTTVFIYLLITTILFLLSIIFPIIKIKNTNPIEIIKAKE